MKLVNATLSPSMVGLLENHGITAATPVQLEVIPIILEGQDVIAQSETGSGKTLGFAIPLIEQTDRRNGLTALVLVPTRELAIQVASEFSKFSHGKHLAVTPVYGGVSIGEQQRRLSRTNIVVATPGRLLDLLERGSLRLDAIRYLVLDEADRMLDMGFIRDIEKIIHQTPKNRQTLLFSATLAKEVVQLSRKFLRNPKQIQLSSTVKPELLHQTYYQTTVEQRLPLLAHLLKKERELALVFCNRKHIASKIARRLAREGIRAAGLHGDLTQSQRERVTGEFRQGKVSVLVATDVAARGLHIDNISHVYNYEIPRDVESYTHRVGRTARAGRRGKAISLVVNGEDKKFFQKILFSYRGNIRLEVADSSSLPALSPELPAKKPSKPGTVFRRRRSRTKWSAQ